MWEHRCDAVFYVAHYIQWFDGAKLTFAINEVSQACLLDLLCQCLSTNHLTLSVLSSRWRQEMCGSASCTNYCTWRLTLDGSLTTCRPNECHVLYFSMPTAGLLLYNYAWLVGAPVRQNELVCGEANLNRCIVCCEQNAIVKSFVSGKDYTGQRNVMAVHNFRKNEEMLVFRDDW